MKNRILHIIILLLLLVPLALKAQMPDREHYWDDIDFNDTSLIGSEVLSNRMIAFLYEFSIDENVDEHQFDSLSVANTKMLLGKAKVNARMYEFVLSFLLNGYSNMGREQVVDYLLTYPQLFEGDITMEEGLRLDSITEPYQKVRVGAKAPDIEGITIDGQPYHLYDADAKHVLVVFWSTDCEYCHEFMTEIRRHLDLKNDYELLTFALAENQEEAASTLKKMRLPGYHFFDEKRWESKVFLDYHITSTPTVFLLDKERNIVCKPYDWLELKLFINDNNKLKDR